MAQNKISDLAAKQATPPSFVVACRDAFNMADARRREALYDALTITYTHLLAIKGDAAATDQLDAFLASEGFRIQTNTDLVAKLLKASVAGDDRKKVNDYANVLRAAATVKTEPEELAAFIIAKGGVAKFRSADENGGDSRRQTDLNDAMLELRGMTAKATPALFKDAEEGTLVVAIVRVGANGKPEILTASDTESLTNAALMDYSRTKAKAAPTASVITLRPKSTRTSAQMAASV